MAVDCCQISGDEHDIIKYSLSDWLFIDGNKKIEWNWIMSRMIDLYLY